MKVLVFEVFEGCIWVEVFRDFGGWGIWLTCIWLYLGLGVVWVLDWFDCYVLGLFLKFGGFVELAFLCSFY